jgi:hypothetical protein
MGQALADTYSSWSCNSDDEDCTGACIGSVQQLTDSYIQKGDDSLSNAATPYNTIKLFNPSTNAEITVKDDANFGMSIKLPLTDQAKSTGYDYTCKNWDLTSSSWKDSLCQATATAVDVSGVQHVECKCKGPATIVAEAVSAIKATTSKPTTSKPTTAEATTTPVAKKAPVTTKAPVANVTPDIGDGKITSTKAPVTTAPTDKSAGVAVDSSPIILFATLLAILAAKWIVL